MKKALILLMVSLQILFVMCLYLSASSKLNVTIDPRIELLMVVQYLSGYKGHPELLTSLNFPYKQSVKKTFSGYKEHPAVKMFARMSSRGFSYDTPPKVMLHLSDPPGLEVVFPLPEHAIKKAGGKNRLEKFIALLRDFSRHSDFMSFYDSQKQTYAAIRETVEKNFSDTDFIGELEDYFGIEQRSYNIILVPLSNGNYGPRLKHEDETFDAYNIISPRDFKDGILQFGAREYFRHLALHEFGHSFVNPLTEKHMDELKKYASLYKPIQKEMKARAYGDWESAINEHIIRAVTTRLQYLHRGKENGDQALQQEINWGFVYVEHLCKKMEIYERNRQKFLTFTALYPQLIETFRELSEMDFKSPSSTLIITLKHTLSLDKGEKEKCLKTL